MATEIKTEIIIDSNPAKICEVLTNFDAFTAWNPFILKAEGNLKAGNKIKIEMEAMSFQPKVISIIKDKELQWLGHLGVPYIFDGLHSFKLTKLSSEKTKLIHSEKFTGILPIFLSQPFFSKIEAGFTKMNIALKKRVEST